MNSRLSTRLLSLVLIALGATATLHATQAALIADASVSSARSSTNFGGLSNLYIGNGSTAFLRFDLGTLPTGTTASQIAHATLTVFVNRVNASGLVTLSPVTASWTESAITDETIPTIGPPSGTFTASTAGQFVTLDVTTIVQGWVTTPATDFGFALNSTSANLLLDSKENDETGHAASLDITITSEGAAGSQGVQGPQGIQGSAGLMGPQGLAGSLGLIGATGPAGAAGATGATGPIGATGTAGTPGVAGVVGPTGVTGPIGATGAAGAIGVAGAIGPTGATGPIGANGAAGTIGDTGTAGIPGVAGTAGATGAAGIPGVAGPVGATGAIGTIGPTGVAGTPGVAGAVGATGATGAIGATGTGGIPGVAGAVGATGTTGVAGAIGPFVGGIYSNSINYPAGSVVDYSLSTYLAVQTNGPSTTTITPGSNSAYWVATTGSASGSTSPASYIDVSETVASATVAIGAEVFAVTSAPSPLVASNSGFIFNSTTGTVTVAAAGTYTYDYDVSVDEPGVLALTDNGIFIPGTSFGRSTGTTQIIGHGQIALNAGDVVGLISDGSAAALTLYAIATFQNIAAFSLVANTAGTSGATGPQGPQGVPGVNGLTGAIGTGTVGSIAVGTVTTSGSTGTVGIGGTATTPTININFPASSGSSAGFVWTTSFQASTDRGPDNINPLTGAVGIVPTSETQLPEFAFAPVACTATSLQVYAAEVGLPFPPDQIIVTAQDNGTNTSMSCQLEPSLPGFLPASSCISTNTFSVNAGDEIQYSLTQFFPPTLGTFAQVGTTLTCQIQ
ncbi:DNRLRE domain-containing protein [Granulicella sp. L46]|uniref:DNRLRE domain-containing protein n=1 Tax=Granulicella sp. L46 TaxID=1641865 RepID=UPI00131CC6D1|nr:DNRLRE domain-containing protein [Granulicella sp. L46]